MKGKSEDPSVHSLLTAEPRTEEVHSGRGAFHENLKRELSVPLGDRLILPLDNADCWQVLTTLSWKMPFLGAAVVRISSAWIHTEQA